MGVKEVLTALDYPDRDSRSRSLSYYCYFSPLAWVFRPSPTATSDHIMREVSSVGGSDSEGSDDNCGSMSNSEDEDAPAFVTERNAQTQSLGGRPAPMLQETRYEIEDWLSTDQRVLPITGKPGTGKSNLMNSLSHASQTKEALNLWQPNVCVLSHLFWKSDNPLQSSREGLLRNLIFQLLDIVRVEKASFPQWVKDDFVQPTVAQLELMLIELLEDRATCIFLDAVAADMVTDVVKLSKLPRCKVCFTTDHLVKDALRIEQHSYLDMITWTRRRVWRPLRDAGLDSDACMDMVIKLVKWSEGVYLVRDLACEELSAQLQRNQELKITIPRTLSEIRKQWLRGDFAPEAAKCYMLALNHDRLMLDSLQDCDGNSPHDIVGLNISLLSMTLCMRPGLRKDISKSKMALEFKTRIGLEIHKVGTELLTRCANVFSMSSREETIDVQQFLNDLGSNPSSCDLRRCHEVAVLLYPSAKTFLRQHSKDFLQLAGLTKDTCWLEIIKTFLVLTDRPLMGAAGRAHVNRVLTTLSKIGHTGLLKRCQKLYREKRLITSREYMLKDPEELLPPFFALATRSNFRDYILEHVDWQVDDVLRHLVDTPIRGTAHPVILDNYYQELAKRGDPFGKGLIAIQVRIQPIAPKAHIVVYESAAVRIIKDMVRWHYRINEKWLKTFSPGETDLKQRTSLALYITIPERRVGGLRIGDAHEWERPLNGSRRTTGNLTADATCVVYVLELDLGLLLGIMQRRLGGDEPTGHAILRSIALRCMGRVQGYEIVDVEKDNVIVPELIRCLCVQSGGKEIARRTIRDVQEYGETRFKPTDSLVQCLLKSEAGYKLMDDDVYQMACAQLSR